MFVGYGFVPYHAYCYNFAEIRETNFARLKFRGRRINRVIRIGAAMVILHTLGIFCNDVEQNYNKTVKQVDMVVCNEERYPSHSVVLVNIVES